MNRGQLIKRAQYARNPKTKKRNKRIKTSSDIVALLKYFDEQGHENHQGITLRGTHFWRTTAQEFATTIEWQASEYISTAKGKPGAKWSCDLAEHIIASPDEGANLSTDEEAHIVLGILARICPSSPAAYAWHHNAETGRSELHIIASSFTDDFPPRLRTTALRNRHGADYLSLLYEAGEAVLGEVNRARIGVGQPVIRSLKSIRSEKKDTVVSLISKKATCESISMPTIQDVLELLRGTEWAATKHTKKSISLVSPNYTTPLHIRWAELFAAVIHDMELDAKVRAIAAKNADEDRETDKDRLPDSGLEPDI